LEILGNAIVGGMESYVLSLVRRLPAEDFRILCLCPFESRLTDDLRKAGAEIYIAPIREDLQWETLQLALTLVRIHGVQLLHAHLPNAHLLASLLSSITGVPAVATIHGRSVPMRDLEIGQLGFTHLTVVCQNAYMHAIGIGLPVNRVHLIHNGVDCDYFSCVRTRHHLHDILGISKAHPLVGFVGRLSPEKAPDVFVRMADLLRPAFPDAHFVIVGEGPLLGELRMLVNDLHLGGRVHFAGVQCDMRAVYHSLELLVSTSTTEGMPFALMEAMAAGLATVATQVGGVPEIVEVGTTGLLAAPGEPHRLAQAVAELLGDPARRTTMGTAAQQRVQGRFSLRDSVQEMESLFRRLHSSAETLRARTQPTSNLTAIVGNAGNSLRQDPLTHRAAADCARAAATP
jgi:glycosyltransferase involved in cell wall biosynthesis